MGRSALAALQLGEPDAIRTVSHERIAALRGEVYPDGGAASFTVQFTNQHPFRVLIPFQEMPAIFCEIQAASLGMVNRQALSMDAGASAILELCRNPLRPRKIAGMINRLTGEYVYLLEFADHAPLAVAIPPTEVPNLRAHIDKLARNLAN